MAITFVSMPAIAQEMPEHHGHSMPMSEPSPQSEKPHATAHSMPDGMVMGVGGDDWSTRSAPMLMPLRMMIPGDWTPPGSWHFMGNFAAVATNPGFSRAYDPGLGRTHPYLLADWAMVQGRTENGYLEGMLMLNFEPLTFSRDGVYEVGQAGEGLFDRQHQHQLVHQAMLALHVLGREDGPMKLTLWGGQGSATIGPPIFMHRASNPSPTVPRKHHKGENPHETFPVIGATFEYLGTALDLSAFSAYEFGPEDSRLYPRLHAPKSFAARIRQRLFGTVEIQVSGERLNDQGDRYLQTAPGAPIVNAGPEEDAYQLSASIYGRWVGAFVLDGLLEWAVDRPVHREAGGHGAAYAWLAEAAVRSVSLRDIGWMRVEVNDRIEADESVSRRWFFGTLGYEHVLWVDPGSIFGVGIFSEITAVRVPAAVSDAYGNTWGATTTLGLHGQWMYMGGAHAMHHGM